MNKKPIFVLISDTHLDDTNFEQVKLAHLQTILIAKELGVPVIHAGDHFSIRPSQKLETLINFGKILELYAEEFITLYAIAGNHDKTDQSSDRSYLDIYRSNDFYLFSGSGFVMIEEGIKVHFLPFYKEEVYKEELQKIIERLNPKLKNILITHYGIDGVFTNDKIKVNSEIKEVNFKAFHKVFIGHYHNASNPSKNIHYIGSTDARNFGEDDNKGATIVYSDLSFERVKFDFKPYRKIVVEDFSLESLKRLQEGISTNEENIRVEFVGRREDFLKVDKKELEGMGVDVVFSDTTNISPDEKDNTVLIKMERKDVLKHFIEYCAVNNIEKNKSVKIIKMF